MNYVQFHLGDWIAGTSILSATERGVYMDLLVRYYKEERPIMQTECKRIARAYAPVEQEAMHYVLETFFTLEDGSYRHKRCDEEIEKAQAVAEKRKRAADARWSKGNRETTTSNPNAMQTECECNASAVQVQSKCNANGMLPNNHKPITNKKEINKEKSRSAPVKPEGVSEDVWKNWLDHRKKKKGSVTELVLKTLSTKGEMAGLSLEEVMTIQVVNNWQGFEVSWLKRDDVKGLPTGCKELTQEQRKTQGYGYDW